MFRGLRMLLVLDSAVLLLLGVFLIFMPGRLETFFHFENLPNGVRYLLGLWGCVFATLGFGYAVAAAEPLRNIVWIQMGIARVALECLLGLYYVSKGVVTFQQAGIGIIAAGLIAVGYTVLYPRLPAASEKAPEPA